MKSPIGPLLLVAVLLQLLCSGCQSISPGKAKGAVASLPGTEVNGCPQVAPGVAVNQLRLLPDFYRTPRLPFIMAKGEEMIQVKLATCPGAEAQRVLDTQRAAAPGAVLVVTVEGVITISETPLMPPSRSCFIFGKGAKIVATPDCKASELVLIKDAEFVSLAAEKPNPVDCGVIDGSGAAVTGIRVQNSGKVHLDSLLVTACGAGGVDIAGRGADRYADGVSLTRSTVTDCGGNGVTVRQSAQFIALDNRITGNRGNGLDIGSPGAILANNICAANTAGLVFSANGATITRNQLIANTTGLVLTAESEHALVYENAIQDNQTGAGISGKTATVCWNRFANGKQIIAGGSGNVMEANQGIVANDVPHPGTSYFNPPTVANPHNERVIWKGAGEKDMQMARHDMSVDSVGTPMDVKEVAARLLAARTAHPDKVIVAKLTGDFVVRSKDGLNVPDHTCILLYGTITNECVLEPTERLELVKMAGKGCASFSGGKVSSSTKVYNAFTGMGGHSAFLLDGVQIDLSSPHGRVGSQSTNAVSAKQHAGAFVVRGCEIRDPGHRAIWAHVTKRAYILGNRLYGGGMTIDFDAYCFYSTALYNTVSDNSYHSAIFLEEGVKFNTAFANRCFSNEVTAIAVWTEAVKLSTEKNLIACNHLIGGAEGTRASGIGVGGRSNEKTADRNYMFNNRLEKNNGRAAITIKANASDNYFAQNVFLDNRVDILNWATKPTSHGYAPQHGFVSPNPGQ